MNRELLDILKSWIRRRRQQEAVRWAVSGLAIGLGAALLVAIYAVISRDVLAGEVLRLALLLALAGITAGVIAALVHPIRIDQAARIFDHALGLQERVSTAIERGEVESAGALDELQVRDAYEHARGINPASALPLRLPNRALLAALALILLNALAWYGGRAAFAAAEERRQVRETIDAEVAQLEAIIEEIRANDDLTEEQKDDLIAPLEQAVSDLNEAQTLEEAYSALEEAREELQALEDPSAEAQAEALQQAGEAGDGDPTDPLQSFRESLAEGDLAGAAEDLREVDAGAMEQAERERLAQELEDLADTLESTDPGLAEQLREAAQAAREGDTQAAGEALENAAQAIEQIAENAQAAQAAGEAAEGVGQAQESIVAAGQEGGEGGTPVAGVGEDGEGDGDGGEGQGEGSGSGSGSGSGEGQQNGGGDAGNDPIGQGALPDGGESDFQPISPSSIGGEGSDWVAVPPSGESGDNVTGVGPSDPGAAGPITVPYIDVLPDYQSAVNEAIDGGFVPPQYRDIIRDYFSSLEP